MKKGRYPETKTIDHVEIIHNIHVSDPYRWMEEIDSTDTIKWIQEQNKLSYKFLEEIPERNLIRERMKELWNYEKYSVPIKRRNKYFFTKNDGLQNQPVLYYQEGLKGSPNKLIDPNVLSEDGTIAISGWTPSKDGKYVAFGLAASGLDWQEWKIIDVETATVLPDLLKWIKGAGVSWTPEGKEFFYGRYDEPAPGMLLKEANYYHKLFYHKLGDNQNDDVLIYERKDNKDWRFGTEVTDDGKYLIITITRGTYPETSIIYRELKENNFKVLLSNFDAKYSFIGNDDSKFYFLTDKDAAMGKVISVDINQSDVLNNFIEETEDNLESVSYINNKFIIKYLHDAHSIVKIFDKKAKQVDEIKLPGYCSVMGFTGKSEEKETFYIVTGFNNPGTVYRYDISEYFNEVFKKPRLLFNPDDYISEQVFVKSKDGTKVPMFLNYKKGLTPRNVPVLMTGYGGFNISSTPQFSVRNLIWMEIGGVHASTCLRGGREYGKQWHEQGIKLQKQNVFDDFIACAEWLISNGITRKEKLAIAGRSNGGLLVGACLTQRPDLFGATIPAVGVLDMIRFEEFTVGWGWRSDYGTVKNEEEFKALLAYSPYHNVKSTEYPPTLITTGDHDDRVYPAHSFKFASALQTNQLGDAPILIRIDTKAGHGGGKPTNKLIDEYTDELAFLIKTLNIRLK